jgi:hypothetical protein
MTAVILGLTLLLSISLTANDSLDSISSLATLAILKSVDSSTLMTN